MTESVQAAINYLADHADEHLRQLQEFLAIPTVSAISGHAGDCRRGAEWVHQQLVDAGMTAEIVETAGHPIVYGEWTGAEGAPTALIYGHYDVQPADPLGEWTTPPFEATLRDGKLFARGATDDKGQLFTHIKSVEAWLKTAGRLPVNVKFVIEGEEEVGSNNLDNYLESHREELACDVCVISDTAQYGDGIPAITYGLRGILACEITLQGPKQDLHSGVFGGAVANPVNVLSKMIGSLHDESGHIRVPGFYDDVVPLTDEERKGLAALPFNEGAFCESIGIPAPHGETGFTSLERRWARPTCDVNGMFGGYQGEGPKTIIPAKATAKITCRLVPHQDPHALTAAVEAYLRAQCPPGVTMTFQSFHGAPAVLCDRTSPFMEAAREAVAAGFGKAPVLIREGGSIPVVGSFKRILGVDTLLLGWGRNTDNLHSPNEHIHLADFQNGTRASAHLWNTLGK
ncbi:MAG: dipeptidase [Planctomycetaceae bacterium]